MLHVDDVQLPLIWLFTDRNDNQTLAALEMNRPATHPLITAYILIKKQSADILHLEPVQYSYLTFNM